MLGHGRRALPADARASWPTRTTRSPASSGWRWSAAAAARRPSTCARSSSGCGGRERRRRAGPRPRPGVASLYQHVPFRQDTSYLSIGERTNANGSQGVPRGDARRAAGTTASRSPATRSATARTCSTSASTTSAATASPTCSEVVSRLATASTLPLVLDSTEPAVIEAGLELLGGRAVVNSVNYEDGDGPGSRFARIMPLVKEHGAAVVALTIDEEGQARTAEWKVRVAARLIDDLTGNWGMQVERHHRRLPDLPDRHRPGGDPPRRPRDDRGDPRAQAALPRRADHARRLQRLVRPQPGRPHGAELGVPARVRQGRPRLGDRARRQDPADVADPRGAARRSRSTWSTTGASTPPTAA